MNTMLTFLCVWMIQGVSATENNLNQTTVVVHGKEAVLLVKKKPIRAFGPSFDNTWAIDVSGPARLTLGIRIQGDKDLPDEVVVVANLAGLVSNTVIQPKPARDVALAKSKIRGSLSQEVAIVYDIGPGSHQMLSLWLHTAKNGLLRLIQKQPANSLLAGAFKEPEQPEKQSEVAAATPPTEPLPDTKTESEAIMASSVNEMPVENLPAATEPAASTKTQLVSEPTQVTVNVSTEKLFPITAKVGVGMAIPQVLSKLQTGWHVNLGAGYLLPWLAQRFEAYADLSYNQAKREASAPNSSLVNDTFKFTIIERELLVGLGGIGRFFSPSKPGFNYFGRLGLAIDFQRSDVSGKSSGAAFGKNNETNIEFEMIVGGGAEYKLGPGAILAEIDFLFADLSHKVTGNTSAGGFGLNLGYQFRF